MMLTLWVQELLPVGEGHEGAFWGDGNILNLDLARGCRDVYIYT